MERGHELVGRVERDLGDARVPLAGQLGVHAALRGKDDERSLGRIADQGAVPGDGVGAQRHRQQVAIQRHLAGARLAGDVALRRVPLAADREAVADDRHLHGGHLVQRERAGLVGVDRGRGAERLDRAEPLHDGAGLGQRRRAGGEDGRHDGGQAGRDRGNRERHGGQEHDVERLVALQAEPDGDRQRDAGDHEDLVRQAVELLRERRLLGDLPREHLRRCGRPRSPCPWT